MRCGNPGNTTRTSMRNRQPMVHGSTSPNDTTRIAGPPAVRHSKRSTICFLLAAQTARPPASRPCSMNATPDLPVGPWVGLAW
eukprot:2616728-Lingulodinium_polyedra.AAC.1